MGLLEPADVDQFTGHRRYTTAQIPAAQVIRRFRGAGHADRGDSGILAAPDIPARNELIAAHLSRLEQGLARTQNAVASLRDLLGQPQDLPHADISHRSAHPPPPTPRPIIAFSGPDLALPPPSLHQRSSPSSALSPPRHPPFSSPPPPLIVHEGPHDGIDRA